MILEAGGDPLDFFERPVEEEVGRFLLVAIDDGGRIAPRRHHLALGHQPALHHVGEHVIGARPRRRQIDMRGIFGRRLEQAGQHRGFRQRHLGDVLAEIELRGGCCAKRAAAHIGAVEIEREDLLFGEIGLQPQCQISFLDLALDGALIGEEEVLRQLLRQRRAALNDRPRLGILRHGAGKADEIDAKVIEEAPVFRRQNRLDQMVRQLIDRNGVFMDDAAMADHVAVTVEEGDGEIVVVAPVFLGFLKGRLGEREQENHARRAQRHGFAGDLEAELFEAAHTETAEEDGDLFPGLGEVVTGIPQRRIEPAVDLEKEVALQLPWLFGACRGGAGGWPIDAVGAAEAFRRLKIVRLVLVDHGGFFPKTCCRLP